MCRVMISNRDKKNVCFLKRRWWSLLKAFRVIKQKNTYRLGERGDLLKEEVVFNSFASFYTSLYGAVTISISIDYVIRHLEAFL